MDIKMCVLPEIANSQLCSVRGKPASTVPCFCNITPRQSHLHLILSFYCPRSIQYPIFLRFLRNSGLTSYILYPVCWFLLHWIISVVMCVRIWLKVKLFILHGFCRKVTSHSSMILLTKVLEKEVRLWKVSKTCSSEASPLQNRWLFWG